VNFSDLTEESTVRDLGSHSISSRGRISVEFGLHPHELDAVLEIFNKFLPVDARSQRESNVKTTWILNRVQVPLLLALHNIR